LVRSVDENGVGNYSNSSSRGGMEEGEQEQEGGDNLCLCLFV